MGNLGMELTGKPLYRSKTVAASVASIVGAVAGVYSGTLEIGAAAILISQGLIAIFLRSSIKGLSL